MRPIAVYRVSPLACLRALIVGMMSHEPDRSAGVRGPDAGLDGRSLFPFLDQLLAPGVRVSYEDPADFLEVITPARVRLLRQIAQKPLALGVLAAALDRDPSAVRRDVAVLERQCLVKTRKIPNPGHGSRTVVERVAAAIELATTV